MAVGIAAPPTDEEKPENAPGPAAMPWSAARPAAGQNVATHGPPRARGHPAHRLTKAPDDRRSAQGDRSKRETAGARRETRTPRCALQTRSGRIAARWPPGSPP